jgi:putative secretion ATPase (PEP-CTERM system associated)
MYSDYYGLTGKPFQLTPDLRFFYPSAGHKRAMSYLRYGLEQGEGFVVITGPIGTGKTLLIQTLLNELSGRNIAFARIATANLDADRVPAVVASSLGLPFEGKSKESLLRTLEKALVRARRSLEHVLLIVDEAQTLSSDVLEELRILSNLEAGGRALLQVFLIGQTELQLNLRKRNMGQLRQRIVASFHLQPLALEDARSYIHHRLEAVGWNGVPDFSDQAYARLHQATQGVPRKINILMDRILLFGYLEEVRYFDRVHIETVLEELRGELAGDLSDGEDDADEGYAAADGEAGVPDPVQATGTHARSPLEARLRALELKLEKLNSSAGE